MGFKLPNSDEKAKEAAGGEINKKANDKFAEMEAKYNEFVKAHNNFLSERGTDPIQKVFKDNPNQEDVYNKNAWLEKAAPLDLNNKTEIQKYQELANKILNYYGGDTKRGYRASINGNIDYYQKTTNQEGKDKAIESIRQSLNNLFSQFGKVHKWFLEDGVADKAENVTESNENEAEEQKDGVGDKVENVTESNENETEEQNEDNPKKGALHKAKRVAGEVRSAVVEKGKAAGRGAKVLGNALLDKASGLKRAVGKKLKRKKSAQEEATPEASAPEASAPEASAPEADSKAVIVQGADKKVTKEDVKKQLLKVTNRYNEFLKNYKKFAKKNKHSLKEIVKNVLPNGSENENWCNKGKYDEIKFEGLNSMSDLQIAWDNFMKDNLLGWLSGARRSEFGYIFKDISEKLEALDDERSADNRESIDDKKLEVMQAYDILARKILRYMQAVLARLNSTASEGIVGRTLKAMTKGDEETPEQEEAQEQKPRNLEEAFIIEEETDDEGKKELVYTNNSQVSKAFENAAKYFKEGSECDITKNQELVGYFSGIKGFKIAISSALKSTSLGAWSLYRKNAAGEKVKISSSRHSAMGVILISMAYLPGGSESILNACDGLKIGGIKATGGDDVITNASNVRKEIKKLALKGATGDKLVNKLKISNASKELGQLIDINALKQIMSKFWKLGKFSRTKIGGVVSKAASKVKKKAVKAKEYAQDKKNELKKKYKKGGIKRVLGLNKEDSD